MPVNFSPTSLDHVALWVDEREPLAGFLCDHLGMHVIEETDTFTLVGIDAKLGKLTLFDADGPRQRGALERVVLRVSDLDSVAGVAAVRGHAARTTAWPPSRRRRACRSGSCRARDATSTSTTSCCRSRTPMIALACFEELGFERRPDGTVAVDDRYVRVVRGSAADGGRPLLNHLALLVDDARGRAGRGRGRRLRDR